MAWLAGAATLFMVWFIWQLFGPNPPIIVSEETTYITEPLRPDGLPDYEQYLLDLCRESVTPENNAAVLMWLAFPSAEIRRSDQSVLAKEFGVAAPSDESTMTPIFGVANCNRITQWLDQYNPKWRSCESEDLRLADESNEDSQEYVHKLIQNAIDSKWRSDQFPPLAKWVAQSKSQLDLLLEATERRRFYFPSSSLLTKSCTELSNCLLEGVQDSRQVSRASALKLCGTSENIVTPSLGNRCTPLSAGLD